MATKIAPDQINGQAINVKSFGAVGDGVTDDTSAINAAFTSAISLNKALYVPSGTYMLTSSAITHNITENGNFVLFGDGHTSILKLLDGEVEANFRRLLYFNVTNDIESLTIRDLQLDQNARGSTAPASPFDYEQSHTVLINISSGNTAKSISIENVLFKDPAADSINNVSLGTVENYSVLNCKEIDRTRTRASVQFSRIPLNVTIDNFMGARIETENLTALTQDTNVHISNCIIETLDWAMDSPASQEYGKLKLTNTTVTDTAFVGSCSVQINNCDLRLPGDGRWNNLRTNNTVSDCKLRCPYDDSTGSVTPFYPFASTADHDITFNRCEFIIDSLTVPVTPTGFLVQDASAFSVSDAALYVRKRVFNDCIFDARAQRSIDCYRNGTWVLRNCKYGGTDYAIRWLQNSTRFVDLTIDGGDFTEVTGDFLEGNWTVVDQTTTIAWLRLLGDFYGDSASTLQTSSGTITDAFGLENTRKINVSAVPTDGLLGDTVVLRTQTVGEGNRFLCTVSNAGGSATYRMTGQAGVSRGTTANRPTPTANEVGLMYLDNTLDADGQPIWWNGSAWVDSTGATV